MDIQITVAIIAGITTICATVISTIVSFDRRSTLQKDIQIYKDWKNIKSLDPDFQKENIQELDDSINLRIGSVAFDGVRRMLVVEALVLLVFSIALFSNMWLDGRFDTGNDKIFFSKLLVIATFFVLVFLSLIAYKALLGRSILKKARKRRDKQSSPNHEPIDGEIRTVETSLNRGTNEQGGLPY